jgi:hypothetical protein
LWYRGRFHVAVFVAAWHFANEWVLSTGRVEPSALIPAFGAATRMGAVTINTVLLFSLILNIARGVSQTEHRS